MVLVEKKNKKIGISPYLFILKIWNISWDDLVVCWSLCWELQRLQQLWLSRSLHFSHIYPLRGPWILQHCEAGWTVSEDQSFRASSLHHLWMDEPWIVWHSANALLHGWEMRWHKMNIRMQPYLKDASLLHRWR